jgi:hypothetical protein
VAEYFANLKKNLNSGPEFRLLGKVQIKLSFCHILEFGAKFPLKLGEH